MTKILIKPFKMSSGSSKVLRKGLQESGINCKSIKKEGSKYKDSKDKLVVNWGDSTSVNYTNMLNRPQAVASAVDKLLCAKLFEEAGVSIPPTYFIKEEAQLSLLGGATVFCRTKLNGSKGAGIVVVDKVEDLVDAKLYTVAITDPERIEYRVHVFCGKVIHMQQKKKRNGYKENPSFSDTVRNVNGGWIFAIKDVECNDATKEASIRAVQALGLDFGAVDVVVGSNGSPYVLEVNTACALRGTTITKYVNAIKEYAEV